MHKRTLSLALSAIVAGAIAMLASCASGPVVPREPTVSVTMLRSTLFTPDFVRFEAKIVIHNNMRGPLDFDRVEYGANLFDKSLFNDTFTDMKQTRANGDETVTFPFRFAMKDIVAANTRILADNGIQVTFRGAVYPAKSTPLGPVSFERTIQIPLPSIPQLTYIGIHGVPFGSPFTVQVGIKNTNSFGISIDSVKTYLTINGEKYDLLRTNEATEIAAGASGTIKLEMHNSEGKTLSMALNALQAPAGPYLLGGSITCATPYGWVYIPVNMEIQPNTSAQ